MTKSRLAVVGIVLILLVLGIVQFLFPRSATSPTILAMPVATSTTGNNVSTTTAVILETSTLNVPKSQPIVKSLPLVAGDTIESWDFTGAYFGNPELMAKAYSEIARLSDLLETATSSEMILSVSIANQYDLLGNGKKEYEYLERAVKAGGDTTSLPWNNLGVLMEKLGAFQTARVAYGRSVLIQPELEQWHYAYIEFLINRMSYDVDGIERAFELANEYIGEDEYLLELHTRWMNQ